MGPKVPWMGLRGPRTGIGWPWMGFRGHGMGLEGLGWAQRPGMEFRGPVMEVRGLGIGQRALDGAQSA